MSFLMSLFANESARHSRTIHAVVVGTTSKTTDSRIQPQVVRCREKQPKTEYRISIKVNGSKRDNNNNMHFNVQNMIQLKDIFGWYNTTPKNERKLGKSYYEIQWKYRRKICFFEKYFLKISANIFHNIKCFENCVLTAKLRAWARAFWQKACPQGVGSSL